MGASLYLPHDLGLKTRESRVNSPPLTRGATRAQGEVTEAAVQRRAKVRAHFEVDGSIAPLIGSVEKGQTVTVVATAVAKDGTPRSKIEAPGLTGWVTSDLLESSHRPANDAPGAVFGNSAVEAPLRKPSALRRSVSMQRSRIRVSI